MNISVNGSVNVLANVLANGHHRRRLALATVTAAALTGGLLTLSAPAASAAAAHAYKADFNHDGYGDVAFAAPYAKVGGKNMAGYVAVVYGSASGLNPAKRTIVSQNTAGVPGTAETEDFFGRALAVADFDKDGYTDLAVGAPGEDNGSDTEGGSVTILWGSASGLKNGTTVKDPSAAKHEAWGSVLAAGDFNGDGRADLASGTAASYAYIVKGGFTKSGTTGGTQKVPTPDKAEFGIDALAAGDTNGDKKADLVLTYRTAATSDPSGSWSKGAAYLGASGGVVATQPRPLNGGTSLALGDINGDGYDEIAIGVVFKDIGAAEDTGLVVLMNGSADGVSRTGARTISQNTVGVPGAAESMDYFGSDLVLSDVTKDGKADLTVGASFEDEGVGAVTALRGSASGITATGAKSFGPGTFGLSRTYGAFGTGLTG
ncbi:FG-GAP-like repeat-containing protein [Streptomyces sp. NPDC059627]